MRAIVDCGNLYDTLISEELCNKLNLKIQGKSQAVGTAAKDSTIRILGNTEPFAIFLEGITKKCIIQPSVVRGVSHTLNLGIHFLKENNCQMAFSTMGVFIALLGGRSPLR